MGAIIESIYGKRRLKVHLSSEANLPRIEADGINSSFIEQYMQQLDGIEYMKTSERPIIGQMNDSIYYVECIQDYDGMLNIPEINRSLNKVPMLKLPLVYSTRMMIQEMENRFS